MDPIVIDSESRLKDLGKKLSGLKTIAVDSESNSFYAYHERLCLMQISANGESYLIDTLRINDLSPVKSILENDAVEKVIHSAEGDVRVFKRELGCGVNNVFDTMVAAQFLGIKECGLSSLLNRYFGVKLNKKFQKANWGARPLSMEMIQYAAADICHLIRLREILRAQLEGRGLLQEAMEEFHRISLITPKPRKFKENAFLNMQASKTMNGRSLACLKELYRARETVAMKLDRPSFKIIAEDLMITLASDPFNALNSFDRIKGVTRYVSGRHGWWIKRAMREGLNAPEIERAASLKRPPGREHYAQVKKRLELLKIWRKSKAAGKNVGAEVIMPGQVLQKIAAANPSTMEELKLIPGLGEHKLKLYSQEILNVLLKGKIA